VRVLHVEAGRHLYGGAQQVLYLLEGLQRLGIENVLVCPTGSELAERARPFGEVVTLPMRGDVDLGLIGRLRRLMRGHRPDIVHLHGRRGADVLGGIASRLAGVPCVLSRRVDNPESRLWVGLKYRLYAHVIAISEGIRDILLGEGLSATRVTCVRSAVDPKDWRQGCDRDAFRRAFELPQDGPVAGMIAQFIPRKGHRHLLAALPMVLERHPGLHVLLFGQGPLVDEVQAAIEKQGLGGHVHLAGFRPDLARWLGCLDMIVHPAEREGLGVSLLQAAAAGLPIIAARAGGMPEVIEDGHNGLLVAPGDVMALTAAMERLLDDGALRTEMGRRGRAHVDAHFSLAAMVAGNLAVYRHVLGKAAA
jgi:glycosyltransferase involved in cell wall biosynthesis